MRGVRSRHIFLRPSGRKKRAPSGKPSARVRSEQPCRAEAAAGEFAKGTHRTKEEPCPMKSRPKKKRPLASKALSIELAKELQNAGSQSSSIVEELQGLLGNDIILLPIRRGSKKPIPKDWQNTTLTRDAGPGIFSPAQSRWKSWGPFRRWTRDDRLRQRRGCRNISGA